MARAPDVVDSLHRARQRQRARSLHSGFRFTAIAVRVVYAVALLLMVRFAWSHLVISLTRANFPFADNQWGEEPLILQLWRFAHGGPLYGPPAAVDSFDYGPLYLLVLSGVRAALHAPFGIVAFRSISLVITLLALAPLTGFAIILARRVGITRERPLPYGIAVGTTLVLGASTLAASWCFDAVHPDALLILLLASGLWLYAAIADRLLPRRWAWLMLAVFVAALLTKLNAFIVFPILLIGLAVEGALGKRFALALAAVYVTVSLTVLLNLPPDARAWTFFGPLHHPYQPERFGELMGFAFVKKPYILALLAAAVAALFVLRRRTYVPAKSKRRALRTEAARPFAVDVPVLIAVATASLGAYFKRGGGWTDLAILADVCVPYVAVTLAYCSQPSAVKRTLPSVQIAAAVTIVAAALALAAPIRPAPGFTAYVRMLAARDAAQAMCRSGESTLVTAFPDLFLDCPNARYALAISWGEARNSYWYLSELTTALDADPRTDQVVWLDYPELPVPVHPWLAANYRLVTTVPVSFGYAYEAYADNAALQLYRRRVRVTR